MNRNSSVKQSILWHTMPINGPAVASFTDDGTLPISELLEFLSLEEKEQAAGMLDPVEYRHYVARRSFQRLFLSEFLSAKIDPSELALIHQRDTRPQCANAPGLNLSFSSSGTTAMACASWHESVGIDIERLRKVENAQALAERHFTPEEALALAKLPASEQSHAFLHYWTAKEAGLKAIGKGIIFGLNTFTVKGNGTLSYNSIQHQKDSAGCSLQYLEIIPQHLVALVKMNSVGNI